VNLSQKFRLPDRIRYVRNLRVQRGEHAQHVLARALTPGWACEAAGLKAREPTIALADATPAAPGARAVARVGGTPAGDPAAGRVVPAVRALRIGRELLAESRWHLVRAVHLSEQRTPT
jgi:hypothetical protein